MGGDAVAGRRGASWAEGEAGAKFASPNPFRHCRRTPTSFYDLMHALNLVAIYAQHAFGRRPHDVYRLTDWSLPVMRLIGRVVFRDLSARLRNLAMLRKAMLNYGLISWLPCRCWHILNVRCSKLMRTCVGYMSFVGGIHVAPHQTGPNEAIVSTTLSSNFSARREDGSRKLRLLGSEMRAETTIVLDPWTARPCLTVLRSRSGSGVFRDRGVGTQVCLATTSR
jgi:hypothetical protein